MKRLQVMIEEELDAALEREARAEGTSKAALIRRFVREHLAALPPAEADPIWQMAGMDDYEAEPIDAVVYR
jgi:hypothetical protein